MALTTTQAAAPLELTQLSSFEKVFNSPLVINIARLTFDVVTNISLGTKVDDGDITLSSSGVSINDSDWDVHFGKTTSPAVTLLRKLVSMLIQHPEIFTSLVGSLPLPRSISTDLSTVSATDLNTSNFIQADEKALVQSPLKNCTRPGSFLSLISPIDILKQNKDASLLAFTPWSNSRRSWEIRQKVMETYIEKTSSEETVEMKKAVLEIMIRAGSSKEAQELRRRASEYVIETGIWKLGVAAVITRGIVHCVLYSCGVTFRCPIHG